MPLSGAGGRHLRFATRMPSGIKTMIIILAGGLKLILLDETRAGLNRVEKAGLVRSLQRVKGHGLTILIIDHDMHLVTQVVDKITVVNFKERNADGLPHDVLRHSDVIKTYLGETTASVAA